MTTIQQDVADTNDAPITDGDDAFLRHFMSQDAEEPSKDADEGSKKQKQETPTKQEEEPEEESRQEDGQDDTEEDTEATDEDADEDDKAPKYVEDDEGLFVKIKVDGEEREFAVKDLKRLAGQESSLTRKSQEVAAKRKQVDEIASVQAGVLDKLLTNAKERFAPYEKVNLIELAAEHGQEAASAIQAQAHALWKDVQFLEQELGQFAQDTQQRRHTEMIEQARQCIKTLSDPVSGIEGWGEKLYDDLRSFAVEQGITSEAVNSLTDPVSFKILHDAMLYNKAKKAVQKPKAKDTKPPKKIVKSSSNSETTKKMLKGGKRVEATMARLSETGDSDDAAAVFAARWMSDE